MIFAVGSLLPKTQTACAGKTGNVINAIGTTDRITANANSLDIASTYVGQTSITTLGTIGSGVAILGALAYSLAKNSSKK